MTTIRGDLDEQVQSVLIELARSSIEAGLDGLAAVVPGPSELDALPEPARERRGVFVTLMVAGELNGCIGSLEGADPLAVAVPSLAWEAAFADPRLPALSRSDVNALAIKVSVLSTLEKMAAATEAEVVAALRPGVDGLVLAAGLRRATFLPSVWESLPDPVQFVRQLGAKAHLRAGSWPEGLSAFRYTAQEFGSATA
jgi:AmmeMemoRadiSam system protein A